jgi:hypothetical protein
MKGATIVIGGTGSTAVAIVGSSRSAAARSSLLMSTNGPAPEGQTLLRCDIAEPQSVASTTGGPDVRHRAGPLPGAAAPLRGRNEYTLGQLPRRPGQSSSMPSSMYEGAGGLR